MSHIIGVTKDIHLLSGVSNLIWFRKSAKHGSKPSLFFDKLSYKLIARGLSARWWLN